MLLPVKKTSGEKLDFLHLTIKKKLLLQCKANKKNI